jgi:hypothetical protein
MKKAVIVLAVELVVLGVVVLAYLASDDSGVRWPASMSSHAGSASARHEATDSVPVSIEIHSVGLVEVAPLARGGEAQPVNAHSATHASRSTVSLTRRARGPCC